MFKTDLLPGHLIRAYKAGLSLCAAIAIGVAGIVLTWEIAGRYVRITVMARRTS